jgi:hypothetical protein
MLLALILPPLQYVTTNPYHKHMPPHAKHTPSNTTTTHNTTDLLCIICSMHIAKLPPTKLKFTSTTNRGIWSTPPAARPRSAAPQREPKVPPENSARGQRTATGAWAPSGTADRPEKEYTCTSKTFWHLLLNGYSGTGSDARNRKSTFENPHKFSFRFLGPPVAEKWVKEWKFYGIE